MKIVKKVLSLLASSLAVLIFSGFLSLQPIGESPALANHAGNPSCKDITGVTQDIPSPNAAGRQAGVADSGQLDFNIDPPAHDFQACIQTKTELADMLAVTKTVIRGWTWNTNLGYVSFECGQDGNNFGGSCGSTPYETVIRNDGRVRGFAWGDNIGWISMGCDNGENSGVECGGTNYGVRIMQADDLINPAFNSQGCTKTDGSPIQPGDMYGYAWTDTVGWMNFCGARAEVAAGLTATVSFSDLSAVKYANGSDNHEVVVRVTDASGALIDPTQYTVTITPTWSDSVRSDQVTLCSAASPDSGCPPERFNAVGGKSTFSWVAGRGYIANVTSIAPTQPGTDELRLTDVTVEARTLAGTLVSVTQPTIASATFEFKPAVEVTRIYSSDSLSAGSGDDSLFAQRNISTEHVITAEFHPGVGAGALTDPASARVFTQLHDCSDAFNFVFDEGGAGIDDTDMPYVQSDVSRPDFDRQNSVCPSTAEQTIVDIDRYNAGTLVSEFATNSEGILTIRRFIYTDVGNDDSAASAGIEVNNPPPFGVQTRVEYLANGIQVKYFSKKVTDASLLNQAADIKGNVRIDVQNLGGLLGGRSEKSIGAGAGAVKSKSEFFNRALDNLKYAGRAAPINSQIFTGADLSAGELFFKRDTNLGATEPCKIIFDNAAGDIDWNAKTTIASRGCDIYINSNLLPAVGHETAALGIVALEDLDMPKAAPRKGGNVYICATVTDLKNVHIVAENSVLPYGELDAGGNIACGDPANRVEQSGLRAGLPKFDNPVREVLKNQLVITGSIVSNNTYGGAFKNPPEAGDGRRITDPELMDTARYYDYNFFRYVHTVQNPDQRGRINVAKCWADDIAKSQQYNSSCRNNNPEPYTDRNPGSKGIMNIQFAPPPSDLPVFNYRAK